jgi:2-amino-4-hydroxy-6-hydroxymethyldihydropteridine diphosphokinase
MSSVWETAPVYVINQDPFYNAVVDVETTLPPEDLLATCKEIEIEVGRVMRNRWGPREIDIDVLAMIDDEGKLVQVNTPSLQLPHPRIGERRFVIEPLREIDPSLIPKQLDKQMLVRQKAQVVEGAVLSIHRD